MVGCDGWQVELRKWRMARDRGIGGRREWVSGVGELGCFENCGVGWGRRVAVEGMLGGWGA